MRLSLLTIEHAGQGSALPPPTFAIPLAGGLLCGVVLTLITLPMLGKATAMERTRYE